MSDTEISALDHCTDRQLKQLLTLAADGAKVGRNWLIEVGDSEQLECLLANLGWGADGSAGLLQTICAPETPVEVVRAIKSSAKRLAVAAESPAQKAAATLLYHLSIASALAHHARNISSKHPARRLALYENLAAELPDDDLAAVFEKAAANLSSRNS